MFFSIWEVRLADRPRTLIEDRASVIDQISRNLPLCYARHFALYLTQMTDDLALSIINRGTFCVICVNPQKSTIS